MRLGYTGSVVAEVFKLPNNLWHGMRMRDLVNAGTDCSSEGRGVLV